MWCLPSHFGVKWTLQACQRVKDLLKWLVNMHHGHLTEVIPEHYSWKFRENQIAIETFVIVLAFYKEENCSSITRYLYIVPHS